MTGIYRVTAIGRDEAQAEIEFIVAADGAKAAWAEARRQLRDGSELQPTEDEAEPLRVEPRSYTVRCVYRIDRPRSAKPPAEPTALELIAECESQGVIIAQRVRRVLESMRSARGLTDEADGETNASDRDDAEAGAAADTAADGDQSAAR